MFKKEASLQKNKMEPEKQGLSVLAQGRGPGPVPLMGSYLLLRRNTRRYWRKASHLENRKLFLSKRTEVERSVLNNLSSWVPS